MIRDSINQLVFMELPKPKLTNLKGITVANLKFRPKIICRIGIFT